MADVIKPLILNQYRKSSSYKDIVGEQYHFPNRKYSKCFEGLPVPFIYYEPRNGGDQVYFGTGIVRAVINDDLEVSHSYAEIDDYQPFTDPIKYYDGPDDSPWEASKKMRNSVRRIDQELFNKILDASKIQLPELGSDKPDLYENRLSKELEIMRRRKPSPESKRKIQVIYERYERPSRITKHVKETRGDRCSLCGQRGFVKSDGSRYCEVHHLFHLAKDPPVECLQPEYLVVLCATCHRRMHYANVGDPEKIEGGWSVKIDDQKVEFITEHF